MLSCHDNRSASKSAFADCQPLLRGLITIRCVTKPICITMPCITKTCRAYQMCTVRICIAMPSLTKRVAFPSIIKRAGYHAMHYQHTCMHCQPYTKRVVLQFFPILTCAQWTICICYRLIFNLVNKFSERTF